MAFKRKKWFGKPDPRTPLNEPGMDDLEKRIEDEFNLRKVKRFQGKLPTALGWQNQVVLPFLRSELGKDPYVISARYKSSGSVWLDLRAGANIQQPSNVDEIVIQLLHLDYAGRDFEILVMSTYFSGG